MIPLKDGETLSRLFHLNSEPWANAEAYRDAQAYEVDYKQFPAGRRIKLPKPDDSGLLQLLRIRTSCREYRLAPLPLETFSSILKCAYGIVRTTPIANTSSGFFRTVPSAGGLFPLEIYILARAVESLQDGIYHYDTRRHALEMFREGSWFAELDEIMITAPFIREANLIFFLSAVFHRSQKKYGPRGYRYILLETGHVAQNLCLAAAEHELGSLCMGGFYDSRLNKFLELDGLTEAVVYSLAIGLPATMRPSNS
jgi:SagB-type dehydrogenase family enzyme